MGHGHLVPEMLAFPTMFWLRLMRKSDFETVELSLPDNVNMMVLMEEEDRRYVLKQNSHNFCRNLNSEFGFDVVGSILK